MDWIYRNIYFLALKTPSRNTADDAAAIFVGLCVALHVEFVALLFVQVTNLSIPWSVVKPGLVIFAIACMILSFIHYDLRKQGARVIDEAKRQGDQPNILIAIALAMETFFLPVWMMVIFVIFFG